MPIYLILAYSSVLSSFIPLILGIVEYKKIQKTLKILSVFCLVTCIIELVSAYLGYNKINTMFMLHLFTPIEFIFIIWVMKSLKSRSFNELDFLLAILILFITFCIADSVYIESIKHFNSIGRGIEGIILICLCVFFFYSIFTSSESVDLLTYPYFWLFAGWLIYFSGTLFLFIYSYQGGLNATFSVIHSVLNIFLNLIFTYTLWLGSRKSIS